MSKDEAEPKSRGGRRRRKPVSEISLKNLRPSWKPGESGNPAGKPKSLVEITRLARELTPAAIQKLNDIVHDPKSLDRDKIMAANSILDRGLGKPAMPVFHGSGMSSPLELDDNGEPVSALLRAAVGSKDETMLAQLLAEAERIKAAIARDKQADEMRLAEAADAIARGDSEEVDPMMALLLAVKADRDDAEPAPKPAKPQPLPAPDFIAGPNSAPWSASKPQETTAADQPAVPASASAAEDRAPQPKPAPPKPARRPTHFPGFDAYSAEKAGTRSEDEARAAKVEEARAQGRCQISAAESFPPDPREGPEVVRFTLAPGGRIRRIAG